MHDAETHACAMHLSSTAQTPVGEYANEYAFFLWFTDDGGEVVRVQEMVDSAYSSGFFAMLREVGGKGGKL